MQSDRELMQQALDLLDDINQCSLPPTGIPLPAEIDHVMEALRARLAQPEREATQEPVALGESNYDVDFRDDGTISVSLPDGDELVIVPPQVKQKDLEPYCYTWDKWISSGTWEAQYGWKPYYGGKRPEHVTDAKPLYTAPPQREWQGLTDEEIEKLVYDIRSQTTGVVATAYVARAIEAKLKEKNT